MWNSVSPDTNRREIESLRRLLGLDTLEPEELKIQGRRWLLELPFVYDANSSELYEEQLVLNLPFIASLLQTQNPTACLDLVRTRVCVRKLQDHAVPVTYKLQNLQTALGAAA